MAKGWTAASDGQCFSLPGRVLQQTYSTRFSDFALARDVFYGRRINARELREQMNTCSCLC